MAHFDAYPTACMSFSIANGVRVGSTDLGNTYPANFPGLLDPSCAATRTLGAWWNMNSITLTITPSCVTSAKPSTWGALKAIYR